MENNLERKMEKLFDILEDKMDEGLEELPSIKMGTKEYEEMVSSIVNSYNIIVNFSASNDQEQAGEPDLKQFIGKEFK